jgi:hypothetical protein
LERRNFFRALAGIVIAAITGKIISANPFLPTAIHKRNVAGAAFSQLYMQRLTYLKNLIGDPLMPNPYQWWWDGEDPTQKKYMESAQLWWKQNWPGGD